jgi:hypothetical protein
MKRITIFSACLFAGLTFAQTNLLGNGGFESGTTEDDYWKNGNGGSYGTQAVGSDIITAYEGDYCVQKKNWANGSDLLQVIDVTAGETYEFSFYSRVEEGNGEIETLTRIREWAGANNQGQWISLTAETDNAYTEEGNNVIDSKLKFTMLDTDWSETKYSFTVPAGVTKIRTAFWSNNNPHKYFDNMSITVKQTASNNDLSKFNFSYAPNPADNVINLNAANSISKVAFYNNLGQNVLTANVNALNANINLSALNKGVYMMNVTIEGQTEAFKILKQ